MFQSVLFSLLSRLSFFFFFPAVCVSCFVSKDWILNLTCISVLTWNSGFDLDLLLIACESLFFNFSLGCSFRFHCWWLLGYIICYLSLIKKKLFLFCFGLGFVMNYWRCVLFDSVVVFIQTEFGEL